MARKDPILAFPFKVTISTESIDASTGFFKSVGGLSSETEVVEYAEGGVNDSTHKLVGRVKWKNIVLKRGMCGKELMKWRDAWMQPSGAKTRRSGTIEQLSADGKTVLAKWTFSEGWPAKWEIGELDASKSEFVTETLEICHEGLKCEINI